jgi:hypothetical protein
MVQLLCFLEGTGVAILFEEQLPHHYRTLLRRVRGVVITIKIIGSNSIERIGIRISTTDSSTTKDPTAGRHRVI